MPNSNPSDPKVAILRYKAITTAALVLFCIFSVISWQGVLRYWTIWVTYPQPGSLGEGPLGEATTLFGAALCLLIFGSVAFRCSLRRDRFVFALAAAPMILALVRAFVRPTIGQTLAMQVAEALCWTIAAAVCATALFKRNRNNDHLRDMTDRTPVQHAPNGILRPPQQDGRWKISIEAMLVGIGVGIGFGVLAFIFLMYRHEGMGETLFILVPVSAGFSIGIMTRRKGEAIATAIALTSPLLLLILLGAEGVLCALLAFPILLAAIATGLGIGMTVKTLFLDRAKHQTTTIGALLLVGPMMVIGGNQLEQPSLVHPRIEVIRDSVTVNAPPDRVWKDILSIDNIQASKPFLMYIGLPIPERCVVQRPGVGAKRTCYFNNGYIEETVTGWNRPYSMELTIDRTHMPGRHWLGFENAEYTLQASGNSTVLTRTTTISSHLLPGWYWRPFERLGVKSEHHYILQDVVVKEKH